MPGTFSGLAKLQRDFAIAEGDVAEARQQLQRPLDEKMRRMAEVRVTIAEHHLEVARSNLQFAEQRANPQPADAQ